MNEKPSALSSIQTQKKGPQVNNKDQEADINSVTYMHVHEEDDSISGQEKFQEIFSGLLCCY
jgi:hypothetical protein